MTVIDDKLGGTHEIVSTEWTKYCEGMTQNLVESQEQRVLPRAGRSGCRLKRAARRQVQRLDAEDDRRREGIKMIGIGYTDLGQGCCAVIPRPLLQGVRIVSTYRSRNDELCDDQGVSRPCRQMDESALSWKHEKWNNGWSDLDCPSAFAAGVYLTSWKLLQSFGFPSLQWLPY